MNRGKMIQYISTKKCTCNGNLLKLSSSLKPTQLFVTIISV